jgi:hypothetical protein
MKKAFIFGQDSTKTYTDKMEGTAKVDFLLITSFDI